MLRITTPTVLRSALIVACLSLPLPLLAQSAAAPADLKQQMSTAEFKAAGLDKLSAAELAALNAWLNRTVDTQSAAAAEQARAEAQRARAEAEQAKAEAASAREAGRKEVITENRGFLSFGSDEPIVSNIAGEFRGFGKGQKYTLANGQVWEQVDAAQLAGVRRTDVEVTIKPGMLGAWYMRIKGYNTAASVKRVK